MALELFALFLPPLPPLHSSLSWAPHMAFFFFLGISAFPCTNVFPSNAANPSANASSHLSSEPHWTSRSMHLSDTFTEVSTCPRTHHASYRLLRTPIIVLSLLLFQPTCLQAENRHRSPDKCVNGTRGVMAWPHFKASAMMSKVTHLRFDHITLEFCISFI